MSSMYIETILGITHTQCLFEILFSFLIKRKLKVVEFQSVRSCNSNEYSSKNQFTQIFDLITKTI